MTETYNTLKKTGRLVQKASRPDPWFGNNLSLVFEKDGKFYQVTTNDAYPKNHPDHDNPAVEVSRVIKTVAKYVPKKK